MILTAADNDGRMNAQEIKAEYSSSLGDLTFNSKPLINMLTMLAEENIAHAPVIVEAIEEHLDKVQTNVKLPILYLIDCIAKNIGQTYTQLFSHNIVKTFCGVFKVVDEETRAEMFRLRQTWNNIFPQMKLYAIDVQINMLDPAWPVTAQLPSNSIHFNPKFLKTKESSSSSTSSSSLSVSKAAVAAAPSLDMETFTMQQKLIQKQKELIELQQKKLKLELLQTQVKLQKQLESNPTVAAAAAAAPNTVTPRTQNILLKPEVAKQLMPEITKQMPNKKITLGNRNAQSGGTRITPANSALVAAAAAAASSKPPTRDPRLLRQQQHHHHHHSEKSTNNNGTSNVSLGSKPAIDSNNKVVTKSVRDNNRVEPPRLVSNKDSIILDKPSKSKHNRKEIAFKPSSSAPLTESSTTTTTTTTTISSSSPKKNEQKSPSKSPTKYKKKDDKKSFKEKQRSGGAESKAATTFKGLKGSKNRNYIRRNRSPSFSPEPQDVDLRMQPPPEKQSRLQAPPETTTEDKVGKLDIDLRQLNDISKKRTSTDNIDTNATKKSKNEVLDALFGNEDTDLRTVLPVVQLDRPPTPPPPIISYNEKPTTTKEILASSAKKPAADFDAVRAKLANATGRDKIMAKSFRKKRIPPKQHQQQTEDEDLRVPISINDTLKKIIISSDDEQGIKAGTLTKEQEKQLMTKIIAQIEQHKLHEAQLQEESEETTMATTTTTTTSSSSQLQPVSDEELELEGDIKFDKDDRGGSMYQKFSREPRRGGTTFWRGGRRRPVWENNSSRLPSSRQWGAGAGGGGGGVQPMWRPIGPASATAVEKKEEIVTVDSVNQDDIKTINIDKVPRDIRFYDETAIVFIDWDDPREISFQDGSRRVIFDDKDVYLLTFNEGYKDVSINGVMHKVKLGAPTREIYIDGNPYECYFGSPGITIELDGGKMTTTVKLEQPPPDVRIGTVKRTDLVAGKVNLIIDAKILVPLFLDAKIQKFVIDGETHTLKFVDALKTVLINDVPFKVEFGGLPKPITVHDKKHFIRFSVLPKGIKPGLVRIKDMEGETVDVDLNNEPALPSTTTTSTSTTSNMSVLPPRPDQDQERNSNSPHFFQQFMQQNNLDVLSSVMTSSMAAPATNSGYQVESLDNSLTISHENKQQSMDHHQHQIAPPPPAAAAATTAVLPPTLNINELFQKLVATGIVATKEPPPPPQQPTAMHHQHHQHQHHHQHHHHHHHQEPPKIRRNTLETLRYVTFNRPEMLKMRQNALYETLYSGMQCSSCGMRFPPEQSMRYSQHLDWHFRQNRKGKKNIRVGATRRWYYSLSDWMNYVEVEDLEERENYFDQQQMQAEGAEEEANEDVEIPSVIADPEVQETYCEVCRDKFDQFFNEDKEEWHLRNALRVDDKCYHPVCYEDYQTSLLEESNKTIDEQPVVLEEKKTEETNIPGLEIVLDDDDEEEEEEMKEEDEQVVIDESDESKLENVKENEVEEEEDDGDDDDVIINEVELEKIEVDDDREYADALTSDLHIKVEQQQQQQHIDDGFMDVEEGLISIKNGGGQIKIKSEPIDPDENEEEDVGEEQQEEEEEEEEVVAVEAQPPPTSSSESSSVAATAVVVPQLPATTFTSSIDGNTEPVTSVTTGTSIGSKIKINISKPLPVISAKEPKEPVSCDSVSLDPILDPSQPLPPGEEPPIQFNVKPALRGVELKRLPTVQKGSELTGMCSIM